MPEFSVTVTPYEREGSNIKGLARIYFENSFIVNNINIVQGKKKIFVSMPSYQSRWTSRASQSIRMSAIRLQRISGKNSIMRLSLYEKAKDKSNEKARESAEKHHGNPDKGKNKEFPQQRILETIHETPACVKGITIEYYIF